MIKNCGGTSSKVPHNRLDMTAWDMTKKLCYIIEFSSPADINIHRRRTYMDH